MLTPSDLKSLIAFQGYGRLFAPLWFMGMEESLGSRPSKDGWSPESELRLRSALQPVMDMREAHMQLGDYYWERINYSYVWKVMARLARGILEGAKNWKHRKIGHDYVINHLGRSSGETFLGDAMPFPASNTSEWRYTDIFPSRQVYEERVWPSRRTMWAI